MPTTADLGKLLPQTPPSSCHSSTMIESFLSERTVVFNLCFESCCYFYFNGYWKSYTKQILTKLLSLFCITTLWLLCLLERCQKPTGTSRVDWKPPVRPLHFLRCHLSWHVINALMITAFYYYDHCHCWLKFNWADTNNLPRTLRIYGFFLI